MLFPYDTQAELTPSAVKIQRENLKQFELANFDKIAIDQLIANRTAFYDQFLLHLWRHFQFDDNLTLSLIAVGGYGRQEMFPLSDLDNFDFNRANTNGCAAGNTRSIRAIFMGLRF